MFQQRKEQELRNIKSQSIRKLFTIGKLYDFRVGRKRDYACVDQYTSSSHFEGIALARVFFSLHENKAHINLNFLLVEKTLNRKHTQRE